MSQWLARDMVADPGTFNLNLSIGTSWWLAQGQPSTIIGTSQSPRSWPWDKAPGPCSHPKLTYRSPIKLVLAEPGTFTLQYPNTLRGMHRQRAN
jgi:hypothetical protein